METKTKLTNQQAMVLSVLRMGNFTEWEINNRLVISATGQRVSELRQLGCEIDSVKQPDKKGHLLVLKFCPEGLEGPCQEKQDVQFVDIGQVTTTTEGVSVPGTRLNAIAGAKDSERHETKKSKFDAPCVKKPRGYISIVRESTQRPTYSAYRCRECGGNFFRRSDKLLMCHWCGGVNIVMLDVKGREP